MPKLGLGVSVSKNRYSQPDPLAVLGDTWAAWLAGYSSDANQTFPSINSAYAAPDLLNGGGAGASSSDCAVVGEAGDDAFWWSSGVTGNNISVPRPVASVDVVVTYADGTTDSSLIAQTANPLVFGNTNVVFAGLKIASIQLKNNSGGAEVGLYEAASSGASSYVDGYANTWTLNQSSTGLASTLYDPSVGPTWAGDGISKYLQAASDALTAIDAGGSSTWMWKGVLPSNVTSFGRLLATNTAGSANGVGIQTVGTNPRYQAFGDDGTNQSGLSEASGSRAGETVAVAFSVNSSEHGLFINGAEILRAPRLFGAVPQQILALFMRGQGVAGNHQRGHAAWACIAKGVALTGPQQLAVSAELDRLNRTGGPA